MSGSYLSGVTVGGELPGVDPLLRSISSALTAASTSLASLAEMIRDAKIAIRAPAVSDFQAQLSASQSVVTSIQKQIANPIEAIGQIIAAGQHVLAELATVPALPQFQSQLSANIGVAASLTAKIAAVDLQLAGLDVIADLLSAATQAVAKIVQSLANLLATFSVGGLHSLAYSGSLSGMGAGLDSVSPQSGLAPTTPVVAAVLIAVEGTGGAAALRAVFKT